MNRKAFTLMEVMVAIIILGVLLSLSVVSYRKGISRIKHSEAIPVLKSIYEAQRDYFRENGNYADSMDDLAVTIPALKNFSAPVVNDETSIDLLTCTVGPYIALMEQSDSEYILWLYSDGRIQCSDYYVECGAAVCQSLGYDADGF